MRRFAKNAVAVAILALVASIAVHGVGLVTLDRLPKGARTEEARPRPSQLTFIEMPPLAPSDQPAGTVPTPSPSRAPTERPTAAPSPLPEALSEALEQPPEPESPTETSPPVEVDPRQAVEQESDDPTVEAPPDARFLAAQNRRVEQETQATETSVRSDSPRAEPPPPDDSPEQPREIADPRTTPSPEEPDRRVAESAASGAREGRETSTPPPAEEPPRAPEESGPRAGGAASPAAGAPAPATPQESIVIDDGFGTFTVTRPRMPESGGAADSRMPGEGGRARGRDASRPRLDLGFAGFESLYGREALESERDQRRAAREAASSAGAERREERWQQYRFAAENFLPSIRPGNQTALNAAASPFATFLAGMHRDIHVHFAEQFLMRIDGSRGPLANPELFTELQIVLASDGRVLSLAITRTSGVSSFDLGAIGAVMDAQPFDPPPEAIKSGDGRVYLIWGFSREPIHACHVTQARPFILPNPPPLRLLPGVASDGGATSTSDAPRAGPFRRPTGVLRLDPGAP